MDKTKNKIKNIAVLTIGLALLLGTGLSAHEPKIVSIKDDEFHLVSPSLVSPTYRPNNNLVNRDDLFTPAPTPTITPKPTPKPTSKPAINIADWIYDPETSFYGPGFYGNRTACGQRYTTVIMGVAHRTLPCGTLVEFMWKGKSIIVPIIDRGPYVSGRIWDLSGGLCKYLKHCFTGPIYYRMVKGG